MAFVTKVLGKILGNKSERDIKAVMPVVEKIKAEYQRMGDLSNDQLREETDKVRKIIHDRIKPEEAQIEELKAKAEETDIQESEKLYEQIDKIEESITEKIEAVLNEVLPTTFAIVKDTARRFFENETLEVT